MRIKLARMVPELPCLDDIGSEDTVCVTCHEASKLPDSERRTLGHFIYDGPFARYCASARKALT